MDPEFHFVRVNEAYARAGGHAPEYYIGKNHFDLYPHEENENIFRQVVESGESYTTFAKPFEYPDQPELGVTYWDWSIQPLKDKNGKVEGLILSLIDVTAKERLLKDYTRQALAVESVKEGILIMDTDRIILYANPSFLRASGFSKEELIGKKSDVLRSDLYSAQFYAEVLGILSKGKEWRNTYRRKKKDKTYYDVDMTIYPIRDKQGKISEYMFVEREITEELNLQQRIRQIQKMEALGTLAAGVAHDFNNILMPIIVNTEMALWEVPKDTSAFDYLKLSLDAAERGRELVKQIISFSRSYSQEKKPINGSSIVKEAIDWLKSTLPSNTRVIQKIEADSGTILADPTQIHQVLLNLFSNAVYAMKKKGGELRVELKNATLNRSEMVRYPELKSRNVLKLEVSDSGCGISEEIIENIFDPFFTTKSRGEGSGMGLSVVHGIVKDHGGAIEVSSVEGEGTTFDIFIPLIKKEGMVINDGENEIPRGEERILLVDDEENVLKSLEIVLKRLGYDVVGEKDGKEALKTFQAQTEDFDLVITDQIMPELSGIDLSRKILEIRPDIPIVICTGFSDKIDKKKVNRLGIRELVLKPFRMNEIARIIRRVLDE